MLIYAIKSMLITNTVSVLKQIIRWRERKSLCLDRSALCWFLSPHKMTCKMVMLHKVVIKTKLDKDVKCLSLSGTKY